MRKEEIAEVVRVTTAEVLAQKDHIMDEEFDARYHDVKLLMQKLNSRKPLKIAGFRLVLLLSCY